MRGTAVAGTLLSAAASVLAVGCGTTTRVVDETALEQSIVADLQRQTAERARVDCPEDREVRAGSAFRCALALPDGSASAVRVTLLDGEGAFRFELLPPR